jgi:hypothetical protein
VCVERKKKRNPLALLLAGGRRVTRNEAERKSGSCRCRQGSLFSNLSYRLLKTKEFKIPAAVWCEVVGATGEESKREAKSTF